MESNEYTYLQNKKWRSITYDWDVLSTYGNAGRLYCLTDFQAAWLLSNTVYMSWGTRWDNCPCTAEDLVAMKAELDYALMSCLDFNPYKLDYLYKQAQEANLAYLDSLWDGVNPSSVNPETPDDYYSGDGSDARVDALCTACKIYVYSYAENWLTIASVALGISIVVGIIASISVVGGIIASVLVGGLTYITSVAMDAMQDESALDAVACCMFNALDGTAITQANFETCLDGCGFAGGSNAAIVRDIIASDLNQFKNWLSFINQVGNSYPLAQSGIVDCPCSMPYDIWVTFDDVVTSEYEISVDTSFYTGYTVITPAVLQSNDLGNPIPSFKCAYLSAGSNRARRGRVLVDLLSPKTVHSASFEYYYDKPPAANNVTDRRIAFLDDTMTLITQNFSTANNTVIDTWTEWVATGLPVSNVRYIACSMSITGASSVYTEANTRIFIDNIRANIQD